MEKNFIERYKEVEKSKKLHFLKQLLLKDSDLQQQFLQFTLEKSGSLDAITAVNIDELRDELWTDLSLIDVDAKIDECYHDYYEDEGMADNILETIFDPYVTKATTFIDKGNYLDAFRSMLAIYELRVIEIPDIEDDNYFVFGEDFESYIESFISSSMATINAKMEHKVLSTEIVDALITLFFERYLSYQNSEDNDEYYYNISHFNLFFETIVDEPENAKYLLKKLKEYKIDEESAIIILHCADVIEDNELYIKVANEFVMYDKQVALKLQKRYKELSMDSELARVSMMLFEKEDKSDYALFVIDNLDKKLYEGLYVIALQIYINAEHSFVHYKLLREYLDEDVRLKFIEDFDYRFNELFYVRLLEIEKQYKSILDFVETNKNSYHLGEIIKPIISIYPDRVFDILKAKSDKQVEGRGRSSYARASKLLQLMLNVPEKKEALKSYVSELYHHQPRLPALRDELGKAGLL